MTARPGLTLIETVAAAAMLAIIAAASMPLVLEVRSLRVDEAGPTFSELVILADQCTGEPETYGLTPQAFQAVGSQFEVVDAAGRTITVRILQPTDPEATLTWAVFEVGGLAVSRFMKLAPPDEDVKMGGGP